MTDSTIWWLLSGLAVACELMTGTFYLLMLAFGLGAGALAAHAGASTTTQIATAAAIGAGALVVWEVWRRKHRSADTAATCQDVNLDIGQTVLVEQWQPDATAHVHYRGADWTVEWSPDSGGTPSPGRHRIVAVQGSRLVVQAF